MVSETYDRRPGHPKRIARGRCFWSIAIGRARFLGAALVSRGVVSVLDVKSASPL